jgi:plastocyanin
MACPSTIEIENFAFKPSACSVKAGTSLTFKNLDSIAHTATSDSEAFNTGSLDQNQTSASIPFDTQGTFPYHCAFHPSMKGTIVVNP